MANRAQQKMSPYGHQLCTAIKKGYGCTQFVTVLMHLLVHVIFLYAEYVQCLINFMFPEMEYAIYLHMGHHFNVFKSLRLRV
jgi:hypothetical protein